MATWLVRRGLIYRALLASVLLACLACQGADGGADAQTELDPLGPDGAGAEASDAASDLPGPWTSAA